MNTQSRPLRVMLMILLGGFAWEAAAASDWQERRLLEPSDVEQRIEQQGRVQIYDGLPEETVDRALDTQFSRMENMMFVGVRRTTTDGDEYADDDCD